MHSLSQKVATLEQEKETQRRETHSLRGLSGALLTFQQHPPTQPTNQLPHPPPPPTDEMRRMRLRMNEAGVDLNTEKKIAQMSQHLEVLEEHILREKRATADHDANLRALLALTQEVRTIKQVCKPGFAYRRSCLIGMDCCPVL